MKTFSGEGKLRILCQWPWSKRNAKGNSLGEVKLIKRVVGI